MNEFQERLKELLEENEMSRLQLAKEIKISSTTINGYFNNDYYPKIDIAIEIAKIFDCSLDYLFGFSDSKSKFDPIDLKHIAQDFMENFNQMLKDNNISIAKAMKDLGMSEYNYYRWRDGKFPKTINLISIVKYFNTSIDFVLK